MNTRSAGSIITWGKEEVQNILVLLFANGMFENRGAEPSVSAISLIAMEPPTRFDARNVGSEKDEALAAIQPQSEENALKNSFFRSKRACENGCRAIVGKGPAVVGDIRLVWPTQVQPHS